jgi:pimeloyl-ACP methyl ester carboxylesterase
VVLGHSLGGTAIPRIARRDPGIAAFVVMAGATRPLEDVLLGQLRYVAELDGVVSEREAAVLGKLAAEVARVKELTASSEVAPSELPLGRGSAFWLDLRAKPPTLLLRDERRPFLVLHGGRDYQVTGEDLAGWKQALAGNAHARFVLYPTLDHLFMAGSGPGTPAEYTRPGHVATEVVADIADWVDELPPRAPDG